MNIDTKLLINHGYVETTYPTQDNLVTYLRTLDIKDFISLYTDNFDKECELVSQAENEEETYEELFGSIILVEYIPSSNLVQWTTGSDGIYSVVEEFFVATNLDEFKKLLEVMSKPSKMSL